MADTYKGATGSSDEIDKVVYKKMRGEKLNSEEWKLWRSIYDNQDPQYQTYETAPF